MKILNAGIIFGLLFCAILSGCGKASDSGPVLASIGKAKITTDYFNDRISKLPKRYQGRVKLHKGAFLDELIDDVLLHQKALEHGLDKDEEVRAMAAEAEKKILIARLLKEEVDDKIEITDEDIEEFYRQYQDKYMTPEVMRASHILLLNASDAEEVSEALSNGASFEELARSRSIDPTAQRGGDIGYFPKGQLMPEFDSACSELEVGEVSGVVKTRLGYHIIKLTDRRSPETRPLEQVREDVKARVYTLKRRDKLRALLKGLRDNTEIVINEEMLVQDKTIDPEESVQSPTN